MNLKQSDKMIAIVGVVILIIAAISIVYYVSTEDEVGEPTPKMKTFKVTWKEKNGEMKIPDVNVGKEPYTTSFTVPAESGSVLKIVDVQIVWEDDNVYGGLGGRIPALVKGQDTLTAKICLAGGETKTYEGTGEGNENLSFNVNSVSCKDEVIEAKDIDEAKQEIKGKYQGMNSALFDVEVTVVTGEKFKFLQPIRSFLNKRADTGNKFSLYITYDYMYPEVQESEDDDNNNDGNPPTGYNVGLYNSLCNLGYH